MESQTTVAPNVVYKRGYAFWMVYISNLVVDMLTALDLTAITTALPTIVGHLHGSDFVWAGSAYTIASTAVIPLVGNLVSGFGRKPVLLTFILVFAVGSAVCGSAQNMNMLIAGRAIQGFGGGGCISITEIIYADMVPLPERGKFQGIVATVWALACAMGPLIGGAIANSGAWRWLFFLNLPLCGIAFPLTFIFLQVNTPKTELREKLAQIDWLGVGLITGSTVSILLAITWGGLRFPWTSFHVLVPLVIGGIGLVTFFVTQYFWLKGPTIPRYFFTNRTTLSGFLGTFFHGMVSIVSLYYLPVYFQASQLATAIGSGVDMIIFCVMIPVFAIVGGVSVQIVGRYRPQNYIGWAFMVAGFGILSLLDETSSRAMYIGCQVPLAIGLGIIWVSTQFAILAPLPFSNSAHALAFFTFFRCFAQSWGIVIGGTILQTKLLQTLPASFTASLPKGVQIAYAVIPTIPSLQEPQRTEVRAAFAQATQLIWRVMAGISGAGLLTCLLMQEVELRKDSLDEKWGLKQDEEGERAGGEKKTAAASDVEVPVAEG
ncbi:iron permease [Trametes versicolor FP-101664 SS1]|uniref:iron permease n=1 Tax=Trametes versicolor (strain FP-101664) TaxID=717944 RepID=UPI0004622FD3|nr:iron permease [Trametes versicolor FP-101664 SS1]EIW57883.1 iron permease [Trametes versicolor FP-101664 SS1]